MLRRPIFALLIATGSIATPLTLSKRNVGGVRLCDQPNWAGSCWYGIMPLNDCISLNSFAGKVLSFRPDEGTECFLMQGRCNDQDEYISLENNSTNVSDLSAVEWIKGSESFICMTAK